MSSTAFEVSIKSPCSASKSPAQLRLERRALEPKSPISPEQLKKNLEAAERKRQTLLMARAESAKGQYEKAKELSVRQSENINETQRSLMETVEKRLESAEKNRSAAFEKAMEKTKEMNNKVSEAQKKREEMNAVEKEAYDKATGDKLASAEERRTMLCEETRQKASAEVAKAKEMAAKKQKSMLEMDQKIVEKLRAAEERRTALIAEQKEKAAAAVTHAKDVAASQAQKEQVHREELKQGIETKLAEAENRRASGGCSPFRISLRSPGSERSPGARLSSPVAALNLE